MRGGVLPMVLAFLVGLAVEWKVEHWHCVSYWSPDMTAEHAECDTWIGLGQYARNWWELDMHGSPWRVAAELGVLHAARE